MNVLVLFTLLFGTLVIGIVSIEKLSNYDQILDYLDENKNNGLIIPIKKDNKIIKLILKILIVVLIVIFILLGSMIFSSLTHAQKPMISTPFNDYKNWDNTWQQKVLNASGIGDYFGKILGDLFGKLLKKDIEKNKKIRKKKYKEKYPLDNLLYSEDYLHKFNYYKKIENKIKNIDDLNKLIDHLQKQKDKLGNDMNEVFDKYLQDLKHIRDYEESNQKENIDAKSLFEISSITVAIMGLLSIAGKAIILGL